MLGSHLQIKLPAAGIPFIFLIVMLSSPFHNVQDAAAQLVDTEITAATDGEPFGGAPIGELTIDATGPEINVIAKMNSNPEPNTQFEGWLVDAGDRTSGVMLSLGAFNSSNILDFQQTMINPYTYSEFRVTQEPFEDLDPRAADALGGVPLTTPFAQ